MELEQEESEATNMISVCNCGLPAEMRTSWTKANPGFRKWVIVTSWVSEIECAYVRKCVNENKHDLIGN
ncbi:hypothetical protein GQ457_17G017600 [Hibiscus cannabinus]